MKDAAFNDTSHLVRGEVAFVSLQLRDQTVLKRLGPCQRLLQLAHIPQQVLHHVVGRQVSRTGGFEVLQNPFVGLGGMTFGVLQL